MQQYVIFNVLKEYCIPKEEERRRVPLGKLKEQCIVGYLSLTDLSQ